MNSIQKDNIIKKLKSCKGKIGFFYKNLETGEKLLFNADDEFLAASVIKLPIFAAVMRRAYNREIDISKKITINEEDLLPSCGAINLFATRPVLDMRTICNFMIALSDNTATNVIINECGLESLKSDFKEIGFEKTRLERLLFDSKGAEKGLENYFVPQEIGIFLEKLYLGEFINREVSDDILKTLKMQNINFKIPGLMEERFEVAHKTGEDDGISNDVGIVYCNSPFVIIFASNDTDVGEFEAVIREISLELTEL